jgi:transcriptional regulator with XRE-family HTH domain
MSAERAKNVIEMPAAAAMIGLEQFIRSVVASELKKMGIGESTPTRADLRRNAGFLSLQDCEIAAQMPRGTLSQYESGRVQRVGSRNRATLDRLCHVLGVSAEEYCQARSEERGSRS